ncbi:unnamed protein product, partial [marine sediment metagenome]
NNIVLKLEKMLSRIIGEDIEFITELSDDRLDVMVDFSQMEQVLMNLIANARDAMPKGGTLSVKTRSIEINDSFTETRGFGRPGPYAVISITDTGLGMDKQTMMKIFEPFFTTKEVNKGTGLGLSIIYGIIKEHFGYIDVVSDPGVGTTFCIYLPIRKHLLYSSEQNQHTDISAPMGGIETILLAEDDPVVRELTSSVLSEFGYNVIAALDGEDAVNKFIQHRNDIQFCILDAVMPKKHGGDV